MTSCNHPVLMLLPEKKNMLRCQHCHLKIKAEELGESYCPECFEMYRKKHYDFEEIAETDSGISTYRCEKCGVIIESQ